MMLAAKLLKCAVVALFVATIGTASPGQASLETQEGVAPAAEQGWGLTVPELPKNSYELSLGLQQLAYAHNEEQAVKIFLDTFPGKVVVKRFRAPLSGIMTKSEDMWEMPFLDVESGTPMFEIKPNGSSQTIVALRNIVIGRWLAESGARVNKGDVIVEYYTLATAYEERILLEAQRQNTGSQAALVAEQAAEIFAFAPPRDTYELSLSLQQLAYACGEYRGASVFLNMFPGKIIVKRLKAPISGIMTKDKDASEPHMDADRGTVVFKVVPAEGSLSATTLPESAVVGRWFVNDGAPVWAGDSVVEYYTIAADEDQSQALQGSNRAMPAN